MSAPLLPEAQCQQVVDTALDAVSLRAKTVAAIAALLVTIAACITGVWLLVILDQGVEGGLPLTLRRGIAILGALATLAAVVYGVFVPLFRRINALYAARLIERAHPEFHNSLITTLQLEAHPDAHPGVVYGLSQAAARDVGGCNVATAVSTRPRRRGLMLLVAGIVLFGVYGLTAPKAFGPSLLRVLGADLPAPTLTTIDFVSPAADASVIVGTPVEFEISVRGRVPKQAIVEFSLDQGATWLQGRRLALNSTAEDRAAEEARHRRGTLPGKDVERTLWYRAAAGDGRSAVRRLEVRPIPQLGTPTVLLTFPRYTRLEPRRRDDGQVDAVVGTQVELSVDANVPAAGASVVFHDARGVAPRQVAIDGTERRHLRCAWVVDRDADFDIRFSDLFGADNPSPVRYPQRARLDQLPVIDMPSPADDLELPPNGTFRLLASLSDDFGLTEAGIDFRVNGRSGRMPLWKDEDAAPVQKGIEQVIAVTDFGARAGDVIDFHLTVSDNRRDLRDQPAYQIVQGPARRIRVVEPARQLALNQPRGEKNRTEGESNSETAEGSDDEAANKPDNSGEQGKDGKSGRQQKDSAAQPEAGDQSRADTGNAAERERASDNADRRKIKPGAGETGDQRNQKDERKAKKPGEDNDAGDEGESNDKSDARDRRMGDGESDGNDEDMDRFVDQNKEALDKLRKALGEGPKDKGGDAKSDGQKSSDRPKNGDGEKPGEKPANEAGKPGANKSDGKNDDASRMEPRGGDAANEKNRASSEKQPQGNRDGTKPDAGNERDAGSRPAKSDESKAGRPTGKNASEQGDENAKREGDIQSAREGDGNDPRADRRDADSKPPDGDPSKPRHGDEPRDGDSQRPGDKDRPIDREKGDGGESKPDPASNRDGNQQDGAKHGPPGEQPGNKPSDGSKPAGDKPDGQGQPGRESQPRGATREGDRPQGDTGPDNQSKPGGGPNEGEMTPGKPGDQSNPPNGEDSKPKDKGDGAGTTGSKDGQGREGGEKGPGEGQAGEKGQGQGKDGQGKGGQGKNGQGDGPGKDPNRGQGNDGKSGGGAGEKPRNGDNSGSKEGDKPADGQKSGPGEGTDGAKAGEPSKNDGGQNDSGGNPDGDKNGGNGNQGNGQNPGGGNGNQPAGGATTGNKGGARGPVAEDDGPMKADSRFKGEGEGSSLDGAEMDETRRLVDEFERRLRKGEVDDKLLEELGWTEAQARKFVRDFRRNDPKGQRQTAGKRFDGRADRDARTEPGTANAQRSQGGGGVKGGVNADRRSTRSTEEVRERPVEDIPPEYRDLLEEYYRSMARTKKGN